MQYEIAECLSKRSSIDRTPVSIDRRVSQEIQRSWQSIEDQGCYRFCRILGDLESLAIDSGNGAIDSQWPDVTLFCAFYCFTRFVSIFKCFNYFLILLGLGLGFVLGLGFHLGPKLLGLGFCLDIIYLRAFIALL